MYPAFLFRLSINEPYEKRVLTHYHTMPHFDALRTYSVENIMGKGEIACNKQLRYFLTFSTLIGTYFSF